MTDWTDDAVDQAVRDWARDRRAPADGMQSEDFAAAVLRRRTRRRGVRVAGALAAVLLVGVLGWWITNPQTPPPAVIAEAPPAQESTLPVVESLVPEVLWGEAPAVEGDRLRAGSRVVAALGDDRIAWEDGALSLESLRTVSAPASATRTTLRLDGGTVAAEVGKREGEGAFVVVAGDLTITVVGTRFGVSHTERDTIVTVEEGLVRVRIDTEYAQDGWSLRAGERLVFDRVEGTSIFTKRHSSQAVAAMLRAERPPEPAPPAPRTRVIAPSDTATELATLRDQLLGGDASGARAALEVLAERAPDDPDVLSLLATAQRKDGAVGAAVDTLLRAAALGGPQSGRFVYEAAALFDGNGDRARVVELLAGPVAENSLPQALQPDARLRLGRALLASGQAGEGAAVLEELARRHRGTGAATEALGLLSRDSL